MAENRITRELENRENTQRKRAWQPPETLPMPVPQEGWKFRWIRTSMMGQNDPTNTSAKFREGWEPVKASDHPEILTSFANDPRNSRDNIEIGGLLLCKAPEEMIQQRNAYYAKQTVAQMDAVNNNLMKTNDERMPLFAERKSSTTFGRGK